MEQILVTRSSMPPKEEYYNEISELWESHWLTNMGVKHQAFQRKLIEFLGVEKLDLLTNGHMALELSMQALNLSGEVITTPFTFASTTHSIVRNGLKPVFCDIEPNHFTIDVAKIERLINDKTCAIVPVHVYGNICDVDEIERIAKKYGLKVIYDSAHSFGETYKGKGVGTFGDASCFSFHATKVFNSIEGGCVTFKDDDFGKEIYKLKNFGIKNEEVVEGIGANAKMNEFCAAMGICNLRHLNDEIEKRRKVVERYKENLENIKGIFVCSNQVSVKSNYSYFPIVINEKEFGASRNEVYIKLAANSICARKYFYPLTNTFDCFKGKYDSDDTPIAREISLRVLTLPLFADLPVEKVDMICKIIRDMGTN